MKPLTMDPFGDSISVVQSIPEHTEGIQPCRHPFDRLYRRDERVVCDACGHVESRLTYAKPSPDWSTTVDRTGLEDRTEPGLSSGALTDRQPNDPHPGTGGYSAQHTVAEFDELRALSAAATPGPWTHGRTSWRRQRTDWWGIFPPKSIGVLPMLSLPPRPIAHLESESIDHADAAFIVAAVNYVRALLPYLCPHDLDLRLHARCYLCEPEVKENPE